MGDENRVGNFPAWTQGLNIVKKWLLLLLLATAVAGGVYYWHANAGVHPLTEKVLTFAEVRQATIRDVVSATGLVEPREIVIVSSESPGTVVRISGRVGKTVIEGEELAHLDDSRIALKVEEAKNGTLLADAAVMQAQAALTQAQANRDAAQRNLKYQEDVSNTGIRAEREQAKAQYQAAIAGVEVASAGVEMARAKKQAALTAVKEAELAHRLTRIKVPDLYLPQQGAVKREFLILERKLNEGQLVGPQSGPLFTLAGSLDVVEVHAQVAEGDINKVRRGLTALFNVTGFNDDDIPFEGVVTNIRPQASSIKGAVYYDAVIEVKNRKDPTTQDWQLRPGMTASVDIVRYEHKNVWRVPIGALNFKLEEAYQSESAKAKLAEWKKRPDEHAWRALWTFDPATQRPEPLMVRIEPKKGETGLKDSEGNEILEFEPGQEPTGPLRVIIGAPPAKAPGFFDQPANVKI
jgi:membrane fusion protein, macrolide-specific efflux system